MATALAIFGVISTNIMVLVDSELLLNLHQRIDILLVGEFSAKKPIEMNE